MLLPGTIRKGTDVMCNVELLSQYLSYTQITGVHTTQIIRNELCVISSKYVPFLCNPRSNDPYTNHTTKNNRLIFQGAVHGTRTCTGNNLSCERMFIPNSKKKRALKCYNVLRYAQYITFASFLFVVFA